MILHRVYLLNTLNKIRIFYSTTTRMWKINKVLNLIMKPPFVIHKVSSDAHITIIGKWWPNIICETIDCEILQTLCFLYSDLRYVVFFFFSFLFIFNLLVLSGVNTPFYTIISNISVQISKPKNNENGKRWRIWNDQKKQKHCDKRGKPNSFGSFKIYI